MQKSRLVSAEGDKYDTVSNSSNTNFGLFSKHKNYHKSHWFENKSVCKTILFYMLSFLKF